MSVDTIGDFLTIIRNAVARSHRSVRAPYSRMRHQIADILKQEGFVYDVAVEEGEDVAHKMLKVTLKYVDGESVIHEVTRVSTPGCRVYEGTTGLRPVIGGLGVAIMTTSKGVMTDKQARQMSVGGEILCTVW